MHLYRFLSFLSAILVSVEATRVMHRPENYKSPPNKVDTAKNPIVHKVHARATTGKTQFAYFTNW
jgi:chitinase